MLFVVLFVSEVMCFRHSKVLYWVVLKCANHNIPLKVFLFNITLKPKHQYFIFFYDLIYESYSQPNITELKWNKWHSMITVKPYSTQGAPCDCFYVQEQSDKYPADSNSANVRDSLLNSFWYRWKRLDKGGRKVFCIISLHKTVHLFR